MRLLPSLIAGLVSASALSAQPAGREIRFPAGNLTVHADILRAAGAGTTLLLLFHQGGGDARGEYAEITPRLTAAGYHVMAVDVRGGGDRFGPGHRAPPVDAQFSYCDAVIEVEAALDAARAEGFTGPLVLWGSSYTAALVLQVGARRTGEVRAVLAFSPATGPPMAGCDPAPYAARLVEAGIPVLAIRPRRETASELVQAQLTAFAQAGLPMYVPDVAAHGSSILSASRAGGDVTPQWNHVLDFLRRALPSAP